MFFLYFTRGNKLKFIIIIAGNEAKEKIKIVRKKVTAGVPQNYISDKKKGLYHYCSADTGILFYNTGIMPVDF